MRFISCLASVVIAGLASRALGESLHGRILDRASMQSGSAGKGVAGARISLYDSKGRRLARKTVPKSGAYRFTKLIPGAYTLTIQRREYHPYPAIRIVTLAPDDTLSRIFTLDRIPLRRGVPVQATGRGRKKAAGGYYDRLAGGMLAGMRMPETHRECTEDCITLSRFYDAEDTTLAYRTLWSALLWADASGQERPIEADVYLAHALDSALRAASWPVPAALGPYLKVPADSVEAVARSARAMIAAAPKRKSGKTGKSAETPASLLRKGVPRRMVARILEELLDSRALPLRAKKAFLPKARRILGAAASRRIALKLDPPRRAKPRKSKAAKPAAPSGPPRPDTDALWKVVEDMADSRRPNPVALYHVALRRLETGRPKDALAGLDEAAGLLPRNPRIVDAMARCRMALKDTAGALAQYDSLARMDAPEWQARGFRHSAALFWRMGRAEKAEAALWRALGLDSKSAESRDALMLLAEVSLKRDSWNPVEALLDSLVQTRPREAEAHFWLGRMALKRQQDGVALEHFQRAAALAPRRVDFAAAVAEAYFAREECAAALKTLKPLRAGLSGEGISIYGQCLLQLGRAKEAVAEFERLQASHPSAENLSRWARALSAAGDPARAVSVIKASDFGADPGVRKALAAAEIGMGDADGARALLEPLAAAKEDDPELHYLLGKAEYCLRDYSAAGKRLTSALRYREDYPDAKYLKGLCLLKLGRSGEAHHYFQELTDSDKPSWRAKGWLGQGQAFAKEDKMEAAIANLERSFRAAPSAEAAAHLSLACLRTERAGEAPGWAAKARKLDPDEPLGLMAAVDGLLAEKRVKEAVSAARTGLERHPEDCDFLVVAAKAQLRAGHDDRARDLSDRARSRCPEESAPYYYLGTLSARAGTVAEARRHFGEYLRNGGDARRVPEDYR